MNGAIKICGLSESDSLAAAIAAGASHVGFVFVPASKRFITPENAAQLAGMLPPQTRVVAVVVDPSDDWLAAIVAHLAPHVMQFHGRESPQRLADWQRRCLPHQQPHRAAVETEIWKALSVADAEDVRGATDFAPLVARVLYDAAFPSGSGGIGSNGEEHGVAAETDLSGGSGRCFDWSLLDGYRHPCPWGLAGGLTADNVAAAIHRTGAPMVDVSSGVEYASGCKDVNKITRFILSARQAFAANVENYDHSSILESH